MPSFPIIITFLPILLTLTHGINSELLLEEGYSVTTLIDGDKFSLNPNSVLTGSSSSDDVIVLDSVKSSVFTVSFKGGEVSEIKKLSGNADGKAGYKDGDLGSAMFNKPKSFAIDKKNNIYIADKSNHVVRKISKSVLGSTAAWGIGLGVACLIGLMAGFVIRPYVLPYDASGHQQFNMTWKHYLMNLVKLVTFYCVTKSALASHNNIYHLFKKFLTLSFNQLTLIFGLNIIRPQPTPLKPVSLLDCDVLPPPTSTNPVSFLDYDDLSNHETSKTHKIVDELKELITFDCTLDPNLSLDQENVHRVEEKNDLSLGTSGNLDKHICANFASFVEGSKTTSSGELWDMKHY